MNQYKRTMKKLFVSAIILISAFNAVAQKKSSELSLALGVAPTFLDYNVKIGNVRQNAGLNLGVDYTYFFSEKFGLSTGLEFIRVNSRIKGSNINGGYSTLDFEQESFKFRYTLERFNERQKSSFLNIPFLFTLRDPQSGLYCKAGAKLSLPVAGKLTASYDLVASGHYPQYSVELNDPAFMGFGKFYDNRTTKNYINVNPAVVLYLEIGISKTLAKGNLYAGFYGDFGINDITKKRTNLVDYKVNDSGADLVYNTVLNSNYVESIKTFSSGVKVRYSLFSF